MVLRVWHLTCGSCNANIPRTTKRRSQAVGRAVMNTKGVRKGRRTFSTHDQRQSMAKTEGRFLCMWGFQE